MKAPFIYFGGKSKIASEVWRRFGRTIQYTEPFCGSAAVLLARPEPFDGLETLGDVNGFIANFWRAVKCQWAAVAEHADYPVIHAEVSARHRWLMDQRERLTEILADVDHPGDARVAGYWLWGINTWIGSWWCDWDRVTPVVSNQIPHLSHPGMGIHSIGQIPHMGDPGMGIHSSCPEPYLRGSHSAFNGSTWTNAGANARIRLKALANRLQRCVVYHGDWSRGLNDKHSRVNNQKAAVFLDPPYDGFASLYGSKTSISDVVAWCRENQDRYKIALCGHVGDYDLPGWDQWRWSRGSAGVNGSLKTVDKEIIMFSPSCERPERTLFSED